MNEDMSLKIVTVSSEVSFEDRLLQVAEECNELSQAILKYNRCLKGSNPTKESKLDAMNNLYEELADVDLCMTVLLADCPMLRKYITTIRKEKLDRWVGRLNDNR